MVLSKLEPVLAAATSSSNMGQMALTYAAPEETAKLALQTVSAL